MITPNNPELAPGNAPEPYWSVQLDAVIESDGAGGYRLKTSGGGGGAGATAANQVLEINELTAINTKVATAANQATEITRLASIDGKVTPLANIEIYSQSISGSTSNTSTYTALILDEVRRERRAASIRVVSVGAGGTFNTQAGEALLCAWNAATGAPLTVTELAILGAGANAAVVQGIEKTHLLGAATTTNVSQYEVYNRQNLGALGIRTFTNSAAFTAEFSLIGIQ